MTTSLSQRPRRATGVLLSLLALLAVAATPAAHAASTASASASQARASLIDATCTGSENVSFSPGITNSPRDVTISESLSMSCVLPLFAGVSSSRTSAVPAVTCSNLLQPSTTSSTLTWNNGTTSTFSYTTQIVSESGQSVLLRIGTITAGRFVGDMAIMQSTGIDLDVLACESDQGNTQTSYQTILTVGLNLDLDGAAMTSQP